MQKKFWILQGGHEFVEEMKNDTLSFWTIINHAKNMQVGDKAILWLTGRDGGCCGLAEITEEPIEKERQTNTNRKKRYKVGIKVTHILYRNPIKKAEVDSYKELQDLKVGTQGASFEATEEEYEKIKELVEKHVKPNKRKFRSDPMNDALNIILYGPPGTGKTYNTILRAACIVEPKEIEEKVTYTNEEYEAAQKIFNKNLGDRIEFITFHQNYSYEDFIQGLRPDIENENNLSFVKKDGVFKRIATRALYEYYKVLKKEEVLPDKTDYDKIKELLEEVNYEELKQVKKEDVPNYVIIIDEINRANISRVFGELITLIEEDKRSHGAISLKTTLPSGDKFIVPSNLYIIGTMNTADKSIALVDIALRRRFEFVAMYPNYDKISDENECGILKKINEIIIDKKEYDFQIGHSYFMGNESLKDKMNKKVIPLLLEYFMNDEQEVIKILHECGFTLEEENGKVKWPLEVKA